MNISKMIFFSRIFFFMIFFSDQDQSGIYFKIKIMQISVEFLPAAPSYQLRGGGVTRGEGYRGIPLTDYYAKNKLQSTIHYPYFEGKD